jgi:hypothetical protein
MVDHDIVHEPKSYAQEDSGPKNFIFLFSVFSHDIQQVSNFLMF